MNGQAKRDIPKKKPYYTCKANKNKTTSVPKITTAEQHYRKQLNPKHTLANLIPILENLKYLMLDNTQQKFNKIKQAIEKDQTLNQTQVNDIVLSASEKNIIDILYERIITDQYLQYLPTWLMKEFDLTDEELITQIITNQQTIIQKDKSKTPLLIKEITSYNLQQAWHYFLEGADLLAHTTKEESTGYYVEEETLLITALRKNDRERGHKLAELILFMATIDDHFNNKNTKKQLLNTPYTKKAHASKQSKSDIPLRYTSKAQMLEVPLTLFASSQTLEILLTQGTHTHNIIVTTVLRLKNHKYIST